MNAPWRTGRKLGRTLYQRTYTDAPSDDDKFLGIMDTPELAQQVVAAVNALHEREHGGYDPRTEVEAHAGGDLEQLIAAWEDDQVRRIKYTEHRVKLARQAEAGDWERRLREELQARDAERDEAVTELATELAEERTLTQRLQAEIDRLKRR